MTDGFSNAKQAPRLKFRGYQQGVETSLLPFSFRLDMRRETPEVL